MYRTHNCGELRIIDIGKIVTLAGWVQRTRKFGRITFIDLRDRYGITQLLFSDFLNERLSLEPLNREFVIQVDGKVIERTNKNLQLPTGEIEIQVLNFSLLNSSKTPPFSIEDNTDGGEELRMKFRYLDLRRKPLQDNITFRYKTNRAVRQYLDDHGFLEIETPFLIKSTPEGARDFVVPSRMNMHEFYALPQSPQTFKQLLMVSGFDRYFQIVRCFRDEDLRADRQPEFTQIDCEMSFVNQEEILIMFEGMIKYLFKNVKGIEFPEPFPRISWDKSMWDFGNDKPDIRFGLKLHNLKVKGVYYASVFENSGLKVFDTSETILGIVIPGASEYSRKQLDEINEWVKRPQIGMGGVAYLKLSQDDNLKGSIDKFFDGNKLLEIIGVCGAIKGDLILFLAGGDERTRKAMSELRLEFGNRLGLRQSDDFQPLWVLDFPLFEYAEGESRWVPRHHPFTAPKPEHIPIMINNSPEISHANQYLNHPFADIKANAYDMVLNGIEIGGGSIRIYQRELQEKMFEALGMTLNEAERKFGFLLGAFEYGAPPHGGIAFGFDRICSIMCGSESIRDFIAFPKNNSGRDIMLDAPSLLDRKQLEEIHIQISEE